VKQRLSPGYRDNHGLESSCRPNDPGDFFLIEERPLRGATPLISTHPAVQVTAIRDPQKEDGKSGWRPVKPAADFYVQIAGKIIEHIHTVELIDNFMASILISSQLFSNAQGNPWRA
jgi:hypothetical protein